MTYEGLRVGDSVVLYASGRGAGHTSEVAKVGRLFLTVPPMYGTRDIQVQRSNGRSRDGHWTIKTPAEAESFMRLHDAEKALAERGIRVTPSNANGARLRPLSAELMEQIAALVDEAGGRL